MIERLKLMEGLEGLKGLIALSRDDGSVVYSSKGLGAERTAEVARRIRSEIEAAPSSVHRVVVTLGSDDRVLILPSGDCFLALFVGPRFDIISLRNRLREGEETTTARREQPDRKVTDDDMALIISALSAIAEPALRELGVFVAVNALRREREALLRSHRNLHAFSIEKDGTILTLGSPDCSIAELASGAAEWVVRFFEHCNGIVPTFPLSLAVSLLETQRAALEAIGFFEALDRAAGGREKSG